MDAGRAIAKEQNNGNHRLKAKKASLKARKRDASLTLLAVALVWYFGYL
ncbi:hypothetical protein [Rhizobium deserti]|nr:hypothetical protein [Rhizobium deserti]